MRRPRLLALTTLAGAAVSTPALTACDGLFPAPAAGADAASLNEILADGAPSCQGRPATIWVGDDILLGGMGPDTLGGGPGTNFLDPGDQTCPGHDGGDSGGCAG